MVTPVPGFVKKKINLVHNPVQAGLHLNSSLLAAAAPAKAVDGSHIHVTNNLYRLSVLMCPSSRMSRVKPSSSYSS